MIFECTMTDYQFFQFSMVWSIGPLYKVLIFTSICPGAATTNPSSSTNAATTDAIFSQFSAISIFSCPKVAYEKVYSTSAPSRPTSTTMTLDVVDVAPFDTFELSRIVVSGHHCTDEDEVPVRGWGWEVTAMKE
jgi:hypothetical protein